MTSHPWSGGFRSLEEEHDYTIAEIDGEVPRGLRGTLFRNGSGRNQLAGQWFAHWFDGDGMITALRFDAAGVHFRNRYVATPNYRDETKAQHVLNRGFGKMRPGGVLANALRQPANVSNTSVVVESGRLLSLWEGGPPYELDPATLETRGVAEFGGALKAFSAHPKIDPDSGELFNFGIDYGAKTTLTPYRLAKGVVTRLPAVTLPYPLMNHDFVLTKNHLVFCLGPILVRSLQMVLGFASFDGALHWEGGKPTMILLVPRDGGGAPRFIETGPFFQFHFANGYEENGAVTLDLARYPDYTVIGQALRDYWRSEWPSKGMAALTRLSIDLGSDKVESRSLAVGCANEFPTINPSFVGKRYRYAYVACSPADRVQGLQQQVARVDVENGTAAVHDFGPNGYVGEPLFVSTGSGEDEGVVVTLVFDAVQQRTAVVGLDARDLAAKPLFTARLKHHVPYPLHGYFARSP
jgi:all-trans-8'-apo-beta-carotenal 15,15'-oxygenase